MTTQDHILSLSAAWGRVSGQVVNARLTERIWWELARAGITADDIACVVDFLLRKNRKHAGGPQFSINVLKVCGDLENFATLLAEARAQERNRRPAPTPRDTVLAQQRPVVDPEAARARAGEQFQTLRDILKKV